MSLALDIARKITGDGESRPAIRIATIGVAIGIAVMILSVSVVLGFKTSIRDKVAGFGGHIQVANFLTQQSSNNYPIAIGDSMLIEWAQIEGVKHVQRYSTTQGILKTDDDFLGVELKGVAEEYDSSFIASHMVEGTLPRFSASETHNQIVISRSIANKLKLDAGARVYAYFFNNTGVRVRKFTVAGIYETHLSHFDNITCLCDLYTSVRLNGWEQGECLGAELNVLNFNELDQTYDRVVETINRTTDDSGRTFSSRTIRELNAQIFAWLDLLDMNIWIILVLMVMVSSVTIVSGLLIIILEHTTLIGTLKALGARTKTIRQTFLWFGSFIILKGLIIGNLVAVIVILLQYQFGIVKLNSATYYVSTVPVDINPLLWLVINVATFLISLTILTLPSYLVSSIKPIKAIRFD